MKSWSLTILLSLIILSIIFCLLVQYMNLPEVHFNDEGCVRVLIQGIEHSCENMPNKYIHVWVK
jgi:hypothetical protein